MTNETLLFRNTRKDIEKRHTANRYEHACVVVVEEAKGKYLETVNILGPVQMATVLLQIQSKLCVMFGALCSVGASLTCTSTRDWEPASR